MNVRNFVSPPRLELIRRSNQPISFRYPINVAVDALTVLAVHNVYTQIITPLDSCLTKWTSPEQIKLQIDRTSALRKIAASSSVNKTLGSAHTEHHCFWIKLCVCTTARAVSIQISVLRLMSGWRKWIFLLMVDNFR